MSGIPIYTASPINAAKAQGVTPQTAESVPLNKPAPPATTSATTNPYAAAQPGAAAMPAPTGMVSHPPFQPTPTPTTNSGYDGPPPPQPGAVPIAPTSHIPPPPKTGEKFSAVQYPAQMSIPAPTMPVGAPPTSTTSTSTAPSFSHPVQLPAFDPEPRQSLEHPPGYQQNSYAAEMTSDQRRAHETNNSSTLGLIGDENEGLGGTIKQWVQTAGTKIAKTESDIWQSLNK